MSDAPNDIQPTTEQSDDRSPAPGPFVVGIATSESGLPALRDFLAAMPNAPDTAFVVVPVIGNEPELHDLARQLTPATAMPLLPVAGETPLASGTIFLVPAGRPVVLSGNTLILPQRGEAGTNARVDEFFRSLAEEKRERAIAVIIAGPGGDGALGVRAIESAGGITLAQSPDGIADPQMPRAAIATGVVDYVVPVERMPDIIVRYTEHPYVSAPMNEDAEDNDDGIQNILAIVRARVGYDFACYKPSTIGRRIQRRMGLGQFTTHAEYAEYLRTTPAELDELIRDLLICVTQFFRDRVAWDVLREKAVREIVRAKADGDSIRVWVPACATGEEAYSVTMLMLEELRARRRICTLQVFASDINEQVLTVARVGVYPASIANDVPAEYLERYFEEVPGDHHYSVSKVLRESVIIAQQDLVSDPPFSKLDLVICRNLLIYLQFEAQQRLIPLFHFTLRRGGYLFLGTAETVGRNVELFEAVSRKWRIYRRLDTRSEAPQFPIAVTGRRPAPQPASQHRPLPADQKIARMAQQVLLDHYAPAAVLVNQRMEVLFFSGPTADFLTQPPGAPTNDLLAMAREGLRMKLRSVVTKVFDDAQQAVARNVRVNRGGEIVLATITAKPIRADHHGEQLVLLIFQPEQPQSTPSPLDTAEAPAVDESLVRQLEYELQLTREDLQSHIEELETANEELRAANEEVMSVNEELQSTNEELETSKEQLQSLNEELSTVNHQLQEKLEEIEQINSDLNNLLTSTEIATVFLDRDLCIKRFTPAVRRLLNIQSSDVGRSIGDLTRRFTDATLIDDVGTVLQRLTPSELEVRTDDGRWYLRRALPYRTDDDRIDGVVITFVDITERRRAVDALAVSENRYRMLVDSTTDFAIFMCDPQGRITTWNTGAERICGFLEREVLGRPFSIIFVPEDLATGEDVKELERAREHGRSMDERWHQHKDGTRYWGSGVVTAIYGEKGELHGFTKVMRDQTERRRMESELKQLNETLEQMVQERTAALRALSSELLLAEERERRELASDLHDSIGQTLALATFRLRQLTDSTEETVRRDILALIEQANEAVRSVTMQLSPPILYQIGLVPALEWLADEMERRYGLAVVLENRGGPEGIDDQVRFILFRSARELLINVAKHAGVGDARIRIGTADDSVVLEVEDSGRGFEATGERLARRESGFGLFSLRERLGYIGGEVIIRSTPGIGTSVVLRAPLRINPGATTP